MRKNAFNAEERIAAINKFRVKMNGKSFTKEQILNMFKENRIPSNKNFWGIFYKSGIIKKVSKNQYVFTSDKPIYYGHLESIYNRYNSLLKKYKAKKPVEAEKVELIETPEKELEAAKAFAIDLLKELGYKIFAPIGVVYKSV